MKTHLVDEQGQTESVDWRDFMENDANPTLVRLVDKLLDNPEFQKLIQEQNHERTNS